MISSSEYGFPIEDIFIQVIRLFRSLGWLNIRACGRFIEDEGKMFYWFSDGFTDDLYLCINLLSHARCAIYDVPNEIFTGWHKIDIQNAMVDFNSEVLRLTPLFSKKLYESDESRQQIQTAILNFWDTHGAKMMDYFV